MSKLKPMKDDAELASVPTDEPVLVELEPAVTSAAAEEEEVAAADDGSDGDDQQQTRQDDGVKALEDRLKEAEEATRLAREASDRAIREAHQAREEANRLRSVSANTEKDLLSNSLSGAQAEEESARLEYERALEAGDFKAAGVAQTKMSRASAKVIHYEGALASFDETARYQPEQRQESVDALTAAERDPNLLQSERDWLRKHPDTLTDQRLNRKLIVAHDEALSQGHARGSEAYFKSIDSFMGFEKRSTRKDDDGNERTPVVTAPVSRDDRSFSGRTLKPTQVMLTPDQRDMAKRMGISDKKYAENLQRLNQAKRSDPERYASTR